MTQQLNSTKINIICQKILTFVRIHPELLNGPLKNRTQTGDNNNNLKWEK